MIPIAERVVLVTGSGSGIGKAAVELFAVKGYKVAICDCDADQVSKVAESCALLSPSKHQPLSLVLDFGEPENGALAVRTTIEHFGRLDVLVNNAGTHTRTCLDGDNIPSSMDTCKRIFAVNVDSAFKATLAAIGELRRTSGNIVFVSSIGAQVAFKSSYAYNTSKAALSMFAKCLALELAPDVRVNTCSPLPTFSPYFKSAGPDDADQRRQVLEQITLDGQMSTPEEIASAIYFLASDEARSVNGHELIVDRGALAKPCDDTFAKNLTASV